MPKKSNTRAAQGSGTIRQRKDGRWEARFTMGHDPGTGKQVQRSVYGHTQKEVRQKLARITAELDAGTYTEPTKSTLGQWLDIWERDYLGAVKPSSAENYRQTARRYIRPALGAVPLSKLSAPAIQHFYNGLLAERAGGKRGLSPRTVHLVHSILHKALKQAVDVGQLRFNPADACTLPRMEKKEIRPLEEGEIKTFLQAIQGHPCETLFKAALFTGMRQGELLGLMWDCVDFQHGTIFIKRQLSREQRKGGTLYLSTPKGGKGRIVRPARWVMQLLKSHRAAQAQQRLQLGPLWEDKGLVFPNDRGGFLSEKRVYAQFKAVVAKIGLPGARFHDLRHTYAVAAIRAGDDIKTVQGNLGHHSAAFTLDVYGHVTETMRQASADRMERFIEAVTGL